MTTPTERGAARARRSRDAEASVAAMLADSRFDALRPRPRRRATILAWGTVVLLITAVTLLDDTFVNVASLVAGALVTWLLRAVVRAVPDLPDEHLDERLVVRRDRAYRTAYQVVVSVTLTATLLLYVLADGARPAYDIQPAHVNALFMFLLFGGLGLPSAVYGWSEREV